MHDWFLCEKHEILKNLTWQIVAETDAYAWNLVEWLHGSYVDVHKRVIFGNLVVHGWLYVATWNFENSDFEWFVT